MKAASINQAKASAPGVVRRRQAKMANAAQMSAASASGNKMERDCQDINRYSTC